MIIILKKIDFSLMEYINLIVTTWICNLEDQNDIPKENTKSPQIELSSVVHGNLKPFSFLHQALTFYKQKENSNFKLYFFLFSPSRPKRKQITHLPFPLGTL